jgi:hypothetical protein
LDELNRQIMRDAFKQCLANQGKLLSDIAFAQCYAEFASRVSTTICQPELTEDYSELLMAPLLSFNVFQPETDFGLLFEPFTQAVAHFLRRSHQVDELIAFLANVVNFGIGVLRAGLADATTHVAAVEALSPHINSICVLLTQHLVAAANQSNYDLVREFFGLTDRFGIYQSLLIAIEEKSLETIDVIMYNEIMDSGCSINSELVDRTKKKRDAVLEVFHVEGLDLIAGLISTIEVLMRGIRLEEIGNQNSIMRAVAERLSPVVTLPPTVRIDRLGRLKSGRELRRDSAAMEFEFSFGWLFEIEKLTIW